MSGFLKSIISSPPALAVVRWIDSDVGQDRILPADEKRVDWFRIIPFIVLHGMCLGVFWVGWSWTAVLVALLLRETQSVSAAAPAAGEKSSPHSRPPRRVTICPLIYIYSTTI